MRLKKPTLRKCKSSIYALFLFILLQILFLFVLRLFFNAFNESDIFVSDSFVRIIFIILGAIFTGFDLYVLYLKVILLARALRKPPVRCRIEDILLVGNVSDGKRRYSPYPIVRAMDTGQLFVALGADSLLGYRSQFGYMNNDLQSYRIYKNGGDPVELGDPADLHLLKVLDFPVSIDETKDVLELKKKRVPFLHLNDNLHITVFREMTFFRGVVDVDVDG